jgi:hypothetical protein
LELLAATGLFTLVIVYAGFYLRGASVVDRYRSGFVIETCPVCQQGHLHVEQRPTRFFGIPRVRRTVRCDNCRSILREMGNRRWRYAIDRMVNPVMHQRFNGLEFHDDDLQSLHDLVLNLDASVNDVDEA